LAFLLSLQYVLSTLNPLIFGGQGMDYFGLVVVYVHLSCRNAGFCFLCSEYSIFWNWISCPNHLAQASKLLRSSCSSWWFCKVDSRLQSVLLKTLLHLGGHLCDNRRITVQELSLMAPRNLLLLLLIVLPLLLLSSSCASRTYLASCLLVLVFHANPFLRVVFCVVLCRRL